ncbi:MAG: response regulator [Lachnospiraceae bacterium]|nr:response regulator [Lachnospiraceae bacterium]
MEEKKIMIADDAVFMRKMIRNTLSEAGYKNFLEAPDGEAAVKLYKEEKPDLTFLDVTMPIKNGLDTLKEIMAFDSEAKVIMCSAIGQDGVIMEAIQTGAMEFIIKPFKKDQLIDITRGLIG